MLLSGKASLVRLGSRKLLYTLSIGLKEFIIQIFMKRFMRKSKGFLKKRTA
jgi:hypothetical protein